MSFNEVLLELPTLSIDQRQILVRRALEIDDTGLSAEHEAIVEKRLAEHHQNCSSAIPKEEMNARLRSRFGQ